MKKRIIKNSCLALTSAFTMLSCGNNDVNSIDKVTFDIQYHRGGRHDRPENTLYSYLYSIEHGATTIECDMQLTKDKNIVLSHEPFISPEYARGENGEYVKDYSLDMREMTVEQIKKYDVAKLNPNLPYYEAHGKNQITPEHASIPTIDELFELVKKYGRGIKINMETKIYYDISCEPRARIHTDPKEFVKVFNDKVKEYDLENQVTLQSFDWKALVELKKINNKIPTIALWSEQPSWGRQDQYLRPFDKDPSPYLAGLDIKDFNGDAVKAAHSLGIDHVSPYCGEVNFDLVNEAHKFGMKVIPWNANTIEEMKSMYEMKVDAIITDNPKILRQYLKERGEKLFSQRAIKESKFHLD